MKIMLMDATKLVNLVLPREVFGNYWIVNDKKENLVSVQAIDNNWVLKSNSEVKVFRNGTEKDLDYYYGDAQNITMRELRTNLESYKGTKVSVEGLITRISGSTAYAEDFDEETGEVIKQPLVCGKRTN